MIFCQTCCCAGVDNVECPEDGTHCDYVEYDEEEFLEKYELWRREANILINKLTTMKFFLEHSNDKFSRDWLDNVVNTINLLRNICEPYK